MGSFHGYIDADGDTGVRPGMISEHSERKWQGAAAVWLPESEGMRRIGLELPLWEGRQAFPLQPVMTKTALGAPRTYPVWARRAMALAAKTEEHPLRMSTDCVLAPSLTRPELGPLVAVQASPTSLLATQAKTRVWPPKV